MTSSLVNKISKKERDYMKNKVIALSLLITALSIVPAFADTNSNCDSIDLNNSNSNSYILKKGASNSEVYDYLSDITTSNQNFEIKKPSADTKEITENTNKASIEINNHITDAIKPSVDNSENDQNSNQNTTKQETTTPSKAENNNSNSSVSSYEKQVVDLVNAERAKNGLSALTLDSSVSNVARTKSKDMATNNYFSHTSPTYGGAGDMLKQFGIKYTAYGENIASGQKTPQEVVTAWMNSSGHRANILASDFTKIGVGYATDSSGKAYWTQMFTR